MDLLTLLFPPVEHKREVNSRDENDIQSLQHAAHDLTSIPLLLAILLVRYIMCAIPSCESRPDPRPSFLLVKMTGLQSMLSGVDIMRRTTPTIMKPNGIIDRGV